MSQYLQRGELLIEQSRFKQAEEELRKGLLEEPENAYAHSLLAISLSEQNQLDAALQEAQQAVSLAPDWAYSQYVLALIYFDRSDLNRAETAVKDAIRINPEDERCYALLSNIHLNRKEWQAALATAEAGLEIASEDIQCTNLRAMALVKLGRKEEAGATIDAALANAPDNALTNANQGWTLLEQGQHEKAMTHFREALRLDPTLNWAREGIVEALKARNPIYRFMLGYFFRMSRLRGRTQWLIIIGAYFFIQLLNNVSAKYPAVSPFVTPLILVYLAFVFLSWTAEPLFDLLLRLNKFGRLALSEKQINASNWVGGFMLAAILATIAGFATANTTLTAAGLGCAAMIIALRL